MEILAFYAGLAWGFTYSFYLLLFLSLSLYFKSRKIIILWFLGGIVWTFFHQCLISPQNMPELRVISSALIRGELASMPLHSGAKTDFYFALKSLDGKPAQALILLTCYQACPKFKLGQSWQFKVKLRRVENLANPGSLDYKTSLAAKHIEWTGYLLSQQALLLAEAKSSFSLGALRDTLAKNLTRVYPNTAHLGIIQALSLGLSQGISLTQWNLFRQTGTAHLMVISGAHISLLASFGYLLFHGLWRLSSRLCSFKPAAQIGIAGGFTLALAYALLAGLAIPAQRAILACLVLSLRYFISQRFSFWQAWRFGLFLVLLAEPHAIFMPGFYLSFIAVAILLIVNQYLSVQGIKRLLLMQMLVLLGLLPLTLFWFSYGSINGLMANLIAIPWVGYLLLPLSLLALIGSFFSLPQALFLPLDFFIEILLGFLQWIDRFNFVNLQISLNSLSALLSLLLGIFVCLFLRLKPLLLAGVTLIITAFVPKGLDLKSGQVQVNVLDVGQGLAVAIHTARHSLIYDTGMKFYQGGDMGQRALIPYLNYVAVNKLDMVVISHADLDHRGGLASLQNRYPIGNLVVNETGLYSGSQDCHQYPAWDWDGVSFKFLAIREAFKDKNNRSCVLKISTSFASILLTGDIEKRAESYLVKNYAKDLASDVLVLPHHGSKTSSSREFISKVKPKFAVISAGFDNRYHFPHPQTLTTLASDKIEVLNTAFCGMVGFNFNGNEDELKPLCYTQEFGAK